MAQQDAVVNWLPCPKCPRLFRNTRSLGAHKRIHTIRERTEGDQKGGLAVPIRCNTCYRIFPSQQSLYGHLSLHPELRINFPLMAAAPQLRIGGPAPQLRIGGPSATAAPTLPAPTANQTLALGPTQRDARRIHLGKAPMVRVEESDDDEKTDTDDDLPAVPRASSSRLREMRHRFKRSAFMPYAGTGKGKLIVHPHKRRRINPRDDEVAPGPDAIVLYEGGANPAPPPGEQMRAEAENRLAIVNLEEGRQQVPPFDFDLNVLPPEWDEEAW